MNEQEHCNQNPGAEGDATGFGPGPHGAPGAGYGGPGYGFQPGMGPWGWYAAGPMDGQGYGPGPMGPPPGYGMGPPPGYGMGPPPGYGGPMGAPGYQQAGPPPGAGRGPSMDQMMEELSSGGGLGSLGKLLDFEDTEFWKGALVGAAAVLLLTNESVQESLFKSGIKAKDAVEKGLGSLRGKEAAPEEESAETAKSAGTTKTTKTRPTRKKKDSST